MESGFGKSDCHGTVVYSYCQLSVHLNKLPLWSCNCQKTMNLVIVVASTWGVEYGLAYYLIETKFLGTDDDAWIVFYVAHRGVMAKVYIINNFTTRCFLQSMWLMSSLWLTTGSRICRWWQRSWSPHGRTHGQPLKSV